MDRRYQVFVSSTFLDLQEERSAVVSALLQLDAFPAGMELFPAVDDDAWTLISRVIEESDYYLLVIGGKYGSIDPDSELSFTEKEFDLAVEKRKPVMAFLHQDPEAIPLGKSEADAARREKLIAFREKVQKAKHVKFWASADDLAGKVALSFAQVRQMYTAVGWIRGDVVTATEMLVEVNELRKELDEANAQLSSARSGPPPETEDLEQGSDPVPFVGAGSISVRTEDSFGDTYRADVPVEATWDDLFAAIGPELLDEAEQKALRKVVSSWLTRTFGPQYRRAVRQQVAEEGRTVTSTRNTQVAIKDDDFGTVLIQLRALGLIEKSTRKRSVADKGAYWTLTEYGDSHLTRLRARRRDALRDETAEDDEDDES